MRMTRRVVLSVLGCAVAVAGAYFALRPPLMRQGGGPHFVLPRRADGPRLSLSVPPADDKGAPSLAAVAVSPDGKTIAGTEDLLGNHHIGAHHARVFLWNADTGRLLRTIPAHPRETWSAEFSADGQHIVTTGGDNSVKVWRVDTGAPVWTGRGKFGGSQFPRFSSDGKQVVCRDSDGRLAAWDAAAGRSLPTRIAPPAPHPLLSSLGAANPAFSPDGRLLAVTLPQCNGWPQSGARQWTGGEVRLYDARTGRAVRTLPGLWAKAVAFSPDGRLLASTGPTNSFVKGSGNPCYVQVCDTATGKRLWRVVYPEDFVTSLAFVPKTHALALMSAFGTIRVNIVDADTGVWRRTLSPFPPEDSGASMATPCGLSVSRDGRTLVSRDASRALVWDVSALR